MDSNNWRQPSQTEQPPTDGVGGDWRSQLRDDSRNRIVNKIMDTLMRHLPSSGHEGVQELRKIAMRFEEKIYHAATSESDYLRRISLKMITMESKSNAPGPMPNAMPSNSAGMSRNPQDPEAPIRLEELSGSDSTSSSDSEAEEQSQQTTAAAAVAIKASKSKAKSTIPTARPSKRKRERKAVQLRSKVWEHFNKFDEPIIAVVDRVNKQVGFTKKAECLHCKTVLACDSRERQEEVRQEAINNINNTIDEDNVDSDHNPRDVNSGRVSATSNASKISAHPPTKKKKVSKNASGSGKATRASQRNK